MAKCKLSGKKPMFGNHVSFSQKRVKRIWKPNIQKKTIYVPELGRSVKLKLSVRALRTVDKIGLMAYMRKQGLSLKDVT